MELREPEEVTIDVDEEFSSIVIDGMNQRKAEMLDMRQSGLIRLDYYLLLLQEVS